MWHIKGQKRRQTTKKRTIPVTEVRINHRGFIEEIDEDVQSTNMLYYIPHHPVKKEFATTPVRTVYDCCCRPTPATKSLNDCLLKIPPDLNDLLSILLRFHTNQYAVTTDIEKAFLNVGLAEEDRDDTRCFG